MADAELMTDTIKSYQDCRALYLEFEAENKLRDDLYFAISQRYPKASNEMIMQAIENTRLETISESRFS